MVPIEETPSAEQISRRTEPEEELASSRFDQSRDGHIRRSPTVELITDQTITEQTEETSTPDSSDPSPRGHQRGPHKTSSLIHLRKTIFFVHFQNDSFKMIHPNQFIQNDLSKALDSCQIDSFKPFDAIAPTGPHNCSYADAQRF